MEIYNLFRWTQSDDPVPGDEFGDEFQVSLVGNFSSRDKALAEAEKLRGPNPSDYFFVNYYIVKSKLDAPLTLLEDDEYDFSCTCTADGMNGAEELFQ